MKSVWIGLAPQLLVGTAARADEMSCRCFQFEGDADDRMVSQRELS